MHLSRLCDRVEFPNISTWSATLTAANVVSQVWKAKCALWCHESRSEVMAQRKYCTFFSGNQHKCFLEVVQIIWSDWLHRTQWDDQSLKPKWMRSEQLSFTVHANQPGILPEHLTMPQQTVFKILQKYLKFKSYSSQFLWHVTVQGKEVCSTFCYEFR